MPHFQLIPVNTHKFPWTPFHSYSSWWKCTIRNISRIPQLNFRWKVSRNLPEIQRKSIKAKEGITGLKTNIREEECLLLNIRSISNTANNIWEEEKQDTDMQPLFGTEKECAGELSITKGLKYQRGRIKTGGCRNTDPFNQGTKTFKHSTTRRPECRSVGISPIVWWDSLEGWRLKETNMRRRNVCGAKKKGNKQEQSVIGKYLHQPRSLPLAGDVAAVGRSSRDFWSSDGSILCSDSAKRWQTDWIGPRGADGERPPTRCQRKKKKKRIYRGKVEDFLQTPPRSPDRSPKEDGGLFSS